MNDVENAKKQLENGFSCAFCKGGEIYTAKGRGIKPLLELTESRSLKGFSAADTIVGKAAAMLFVRAGAAKVYGGVMSEKGKQILEKYGIECSFSELVPVIINRKGDGECPMEILVKDIDDPNEAYYRIKEKVAEIHTADSADAE